MVVKSTADYIKSMTPTGASLYMLIFMGFVLVSLAIEGTVRIPDYVYVLALAAFTIWLIYVKLIVPDPLQL
jgi:hypothetical protein